MKPKKLQKLQNLKIKNDRILLNTSPNRSTNRHSYKDDRVIKNLDKKHNSKDNKHVKFKGSPPRMSKKKSTLQADEEAK